MLLTRPPPKAWPRISPLGNATDVSKNRKKYPAAMIPITKTITTQPFLLISFCQIESDVVEPFSLEGGDADCGGSVSQALIVAISRCRSSGVIGLAPLSNHRPWHAVACRICEVCKSMDLRGFEP